jgi:SPP1 Gp6-like portal protein
MVHSLSEVRKIIQDSSSARGNEHTRLKRIDSYLHGIQDRPYLPYNATVEFRQLRDRAKYNLLPLIVDSAADSLRIDGYKTPGAKDDSPAWNSWETAGMDAKHAKLISAAVADGYAYAQVLPGTLGPYVKCYSARTAYAFYDDPVEDPHPEYVLLLKTNGDPKGFVDNEAEYIITKDDSGALSLSDPAFHGMGVCPFVKVAPDMDLDGRCVGDVEPFIGIQDRLTQSVMDLLIVATYGAHRIIMVSGVETPIDPATKKPIPMNSSPKRTWQTEAPDARMQVANGADMSSQIKVVDQAAAHLAIASRTPAQVLMSDLTNIGEGTLTAAGLSFQAKISGYKLLLSEQFKAIFNLILKADNQSEDPAAKVNWADVGSRSLAQIADPLVKLAQGLAIPPEVLWPMVPGLTQQNIEEAKRLKAEQDPLNAMRSAGFGQPQQAPPPVPSG